MNPCFPGKLLESDGFPNMSFDFTNSQLRQGCQIFSHEPNAMSLEIHEAAYWSHHRNDVKNWDTER